MHQRAACPTTTNIIYLDQLVNQTETACKQDGVISPDTPGIFGRNTPFGFVWNDTTPTNCTIYTITAAFQGGISCTTVAGGGNITLNGRLTSVKYRFPFGSDYPVSDGCNCSPGPSPIQVKAFRIL